MALALDAVLIVLLAVTIGFCIRLERRLGTLRRSEGELREILATFMRASEAAERQLSCLRDSGAATLKALDESVKRANAIRDELDVMIGSGDRLANRLDGVISFARAREARAGATARVPPRQAPADSARKETSGREARALAGAGTASEIERQLLEALQGAR
jgi:hypothetical protein